MCKYNVGEMVKLRNDLEEGKYYGAIEFLTGMKELQNKPIRINSVDHDDNTYFVETEDSWWISDEMIEGFWRENKPKLKLIDVLNMMGNGELQAGTKVIYRGMEFTCRNQSLYDNEDDTIFFYIDETPDLSRECELIEPSKQKERTIEGYDIDGYEIEEIDYTKWAMAAKDVKLQILMDKIKELTQKTNAQTTILLSQEKEIKDIKEQLDY